jgi:class 3 adenylate cyclase
MLHAMGRTPDTLYARDGDAHLAYQVVGDRGPDLLFGSQIVFTDRGEHQLKGIPGAWRVFAVNDSRG